MAARYEIWPVGFVESPLVDRADAPCQGREGAPEAWLVFEPAAIDGTPIVDVKPVLGHVR